MAVLNPYHTLEVKPTATQAEIRAAYKRLAFLHHPDRNKGSALHTERFKDIVEAYDILMDPDKRARFDRRFGTARSHEHRNTPPQPGGQGGSSPYGNPYTYNPFSGQRPQPRPQPGHSVRGGRRYESPSAHTVFIALAIMGCLIMASLWFGSIMNRHAAKSALKDGDYLSALEFDSSYADAWFAKGEGMVRKGLYAEGLADMNRAFALTDDVHPIWFWRRGRVEEELLRFKDADESYRQCAMVSPPEGEPALSKDSLLIRRAGLALWYLRRPDTAYSLLKQVHSEALLSPNLLFMTGLASLQTGRATESIPLLQAAAERDYEVPECWYLMGFAYRATADSAQACMAWDFARIQGKLEADSLLQRYCTFGAHTFNSSPH